MGCRSSGARSHSCRMSTRREFLRTLAVGAAALAFAPRLLSSPPKIKTLWNWIEETRARSATSFRVSMGIEALEWCRVQARASGLAWNDVRVKVDCENRPFRCCYGEKTKYNPTGRLWVEPYISIMALHGIVTRVNPAWKVAEEESCFVWRNPRERYTDEGCLFKRSTFEIVQTERGVDLHSNLFV